MNFLANLIIGAVGTVVNTSVEQFDKLRTIRKLAVAIVGIGTIMATRYGIDLAPIEQLLLDAVVSTLTLIFIYQVPNKPK